MCVCAADGIRLWHCANHSSLHNYKEQRAAGNHHWSLHTHTHSDTGWVHYHWSTQHRLWGEMECMTVRGDTIETQTRSCGATKRRQREEGLTPNRIKQMQMTGKAVKRLNSVSVSCELVVVTCPHTQSIRVCVLVACESVCVLSLLVLSVTATTSPLIRVQGNTQGRLADCVCDARISFFRRWEWWELWSSATPWFQYVTTEFQCNVSSASRYREQDSSQARVLLPEADCGKGERRSPSPRRRYRALTSWWSNIHTNSVQH